MTDWGKDNEIHPPEPEDPANPVESYAQPVAPAEPAPEPEPGGISRSQWTYIALVVALTAGALVYHRLFGSELGRTSMLFLGIPAVLAILIALTPKARTVTGGIIKGITLALLIVAPMLGEGYLCILFASPLFYAVGLIVGILVDSSRRHRTTTLSCVTLFLIPMCLEGTTPELTFHRAQSVQATRVLEATPQQVEAALARSPQVETPLPRFLEIGFPRPLSARGDGLEPGATRTIHFAGAEGDPPGDLVMAVSRHASSSDSGYALFETVSDTTKLTQWIRWQGSEVRWQAIDSRHTAVTWQIHFTRELDPAWYFTPWERAAVRAAAGYLIEANANPHAVPASSSTPHPIGKAGSQ
jgi:hypothetical protein